MISLLFLTFALIHFGQAAYNCTFDKLKDQPPRDWPVYLKKNIEEPGLKGSEVLGMEWTLEPKYSLLLVCPGDGNFLKSSTNRYTLTRTVSVPCSNDGSFSLEGVRLKDLKCAWSYTLEFKLYGLGGKNFCDKFEGSTAAHLVYGLTRDDYLRELVPRVCSDMRTGQPVFTFHRIQKEHLSSGRKDFDLLQKLTSILWVDRVVEHRMVPEEELISFPFIKVDKEDLYTLTVLMYASISENNMAKVEDFVRSKAWENEDQFTEVFTVSIDLEGVKKLRVKNRWLPLIVAKIIKTKEFCLGLLVVNRLERVSEAESICKSECEKHSLMFDDNPKFGRVLCCPYSSISGYIPEDLQSTYLKQCNS